MTAQRKEIDRKIVPRFHSLEAAARQGETASTNSRLRSVLSTRTAADAAALLARRQDWEEHQSRAFAADLVATALVLGTQDDARDAAHFLLTSDAHPLSRHLARRLLGEEPSDVIELDPFQSDDVRSRIRGIKRAVRRDPRAALLWAELARRYATLGHREKARTAIAIGLLLSPSGRFLLRSAARLYVHLDDPERAHRLLASAAAIKSDPWLAAAEIAVAPLAGRQSRFRRHGKRLLESGQFRPLAISELASALATEEMAAGSTRAARRLFEASLREPTENAVAQAEWASRRGARIDVDHQLLNEVEDSFEARAQVSAVAGDSDGAIHNAWAWLRAEPFASVPAVFGSHEAAIARRYDESIRFAELGLIANPDEFLLRNNMAFALASSDQVGAAESQISAIEDSALNEEQRRIYTATCGLIAFRRGDLATGRQLYNETIETAKDPTLQAVAAVLLAREEIRAHTPFGPIARRAAEQFVDMAKDSRHARVDRLPGWMAHLDAEEYAADS